MSLDIGSALSALRREKNISQRVAASELGISQALLSHYENGIREPRLEFIVKVCQYYGISADYLLGRTTALENPLVSEEEVPDSESFQHLTLSFSGIVAHLLQTLGPDAGRLTEKHLSAALCRLLLCSGVTMPSMPTELAKQLCSAQMALCEAEALACGKNADVPPNEATVSLMAEEEQALAALLPKEKIKSV